MPSDTDICNAALIELGDTPITALTENSDRAVACRLKYFRARDALLRLHPWPWALRWVALAQLKQAPMALELLPDPHFQSQVIYTMAYALPHDCLRVHRFAPHNYHWRIVGKQIYTDASPQTISPSQLMGLQPGAPIPGVTATGNPSTVGVEYIRQVEDSNEFDSLFVDALIAKMTMELAFSITALSSLAANAKTVFEEKLAEAGYSAGAEQTADDHLYDTTLVDVRNTGPGGWRY